MSLLIGQFGSPKFAQTVFGGGNAGTLKFTFGNVVACLGDYSSHGGTITTSGGNTEVFCNSKLVAINGASHTCPIPGHGVTSLTSVITQKYVNGSLVLTFGAIAGCGAKITIIPSGAPLASMRKVITN